MQSVISIYYHSHVIRNTLRELKSLHSIEELGIFMTVLKLGSQELGFLKLRYLGTHCTIYNHATWLLFIMNHKKDLIITIASLFT